MPAAREKSRLLAVYASSAGKITSTCRLCQQLSSCERGEVLWRTGQSLLLIHRYLHGQKNPGMRLRTRKALDWRKCINILIYVQVHVYTKTVSSVHVMYMHACMHTDIFVVYWLEVHKHRSHSSCVHTHIPHARTHTHTHTHTDTWKNLLQTVESCFPAFNYFEGTSTHIDMLRHAFFLLHYVFLPSYSLDMNNSRQMHTHIHIHAFFLMPFHSHIHIDIHTCIDIWKIPSSIWFQFPPRRRYLPFQCPTPLQWQEQPRPWRCPVCMEVCVYVCMQVRKIFAFSMPNSFTMTGTTSSLTLPCMHAIMCVCKQVCTYTLQVCTYTLQVCTYTLMCVSWSVVLDIVLYVCTSVCMHVCMYAGMYLYINVHAVVSYSVTWSASRTTRQLHTSIYVRARTYIVRLCEYICMYICVCVYIYIHFSGFQYLYYQVSLWVCT